MIVTKFRDTISKNIFSKMVIKPYMQEKEITIIEEILCNLKPENCLEWGAGYSTIYFTKFIKKSAKWLSIEHDKEWSNKLSYYLLLNPVIKGRRHYEWAVFHLCSRVSAISFKSHKFLKAIIKTNGIQQQIKIINVVPNHFPWSDECQDGSYSDLKDYVEFPSGFENFDFILIDGRARKDCLIKAHEIIDDKCIVILHDANRKNYQKSFDLFKYQMLFSDNRNDAGGLWIGSKGIEINDVLNLDKHRKIWYE